MARQQQSTSGEHADAPDAITQLVEDHRRIDQLFEEFEQAGPTAHKTKARLVHEMIRELSIHAVIEEEFLYPAARNGFTGGMELAEEALSEHQAVKVLLHDLERMEPQQPRFDEIVHELIEEVREHVEEEEQELFPRLRTALGPERLRSMGRALQAARPMAPTRPHPNAPNTPPLNYMVGPIAAIADRVRDTLRETVS